MNKKRRSLLVLIVIVLIACSSMLVKTSLKNSEKNSSVTELADVEVKDNLHSSVTEDDNMYIDEDVLIEEDVLTEEDVQSDKKTVYLKEKVPVIPSTSNSSTQENDENQDKTVVNKSENSSNRTSSGGESSKNENVKKPEKPQEQEKPQEPAKPQEPQKPQIDGTSASADIKGVVDENNKLTKSVQMKSEQGVQAVVPAGVKIADGTTTLKLTITEKEKSDSDVTVEQTENLDAYDIHIEGIAADNKTPITIELGEVLSAGLNKGNLSIYHVENGKTVEMTEVASTEDFTAHNQFAYNPENGALAVAMMSFSEVAVVADTVNAWEGAFDYTWYDESKTEFTIANADQLAAFGAIVGGIAKDEQGNALDVDSFEDKTVKLISDINLGDKENANEELIFYPIGYYYTDDNNGDGTKGDYYSTVNSFEGTFDGNGHKIANFYQNTWEIKGDYDGNYYSDAMGLFGYVVNGTIENLTVDNFSSDGEYTPTGVIAAYAVNATFENIAITNCNPRVYNTGNGGIIGVAGRENKAEEAITLKNITVDNSNKISALWGSWDVACGGLVGMYRGNVDGNGNPTGDTIHFENCHVSAQIDVYNDVCANYQYYAYRYSGMMIGSVRHNKTEGGNVYPDMTGISASGCTVHFGTWNDYYYCELVANTLASYTHDHQFSRLTEIKAIDGSKITYLDGTTGTVPASGRVNYVVVDYEKGHGTENATCYHFVDGVVWNHANAGKETVNGNEVLKEDNQHIYLEFNNLFTGYGWGVTTKAITDYEQNQIKILDREVANSVVKFAKSDEAEESYTTETTVKIGNLFKSATINDKKLTIKPENVQVTVSPADKDSTAEGTYVPYTEVEGAKDWTDGVITFNGQGNAKVTITDYYFCTPTTITVKITERVAVEKFETKFTNDYLYRVGNANTVELGSLFDGKGIIGSVGVNVTSIVGTSVSATYTANEMDWTQGTIKFSGTGIVEITIKDDDTYCKPTKLVLEVVDGENITAKTDAKSENLVLLNNISGGFTVSNGCTFYGNGFEIKCSGDGSYRSAALSYGFVTVEKGGVLDNVQIICDIFPESYLYTGEMKAGSDGRYPYGYSAVVIGGNSTISNCYIYGARNNILVTTGNVTIENTVTECGSLSNIQIKSTQDYTVTLDNVTTIQYQTTSKYDTSKKVLGFGVVVGDNESESNPTIKLLGDFRQYNWVTSNDISISNTYANTAIKSALNETAYQHTVNGTTTVNTGIAYLNGKDAVIDDTRNNTTEVPYVLNYITMSGYTGKVYSVSEASTWDYTASRYNAITDGIAMKDGVIQYKPIKNRNINPVLTFADTNAAITIEYKYDDARGETLGKVSLDLDSIAGGSYAFKFDNLNVVKYGYELNYSVKDLEGKTIDKETEIPLNELTTKEYVLVVTDDKMYSATGEVNSAEPIKFEIPFIINATKTSIEPPKFTNKNEATAIRLVEKKGGDWRPAYTVLTGVTVSYWSQSETKVKTVDLSTLYSEGTISSNVWTYTCPDYTLTITGGAVHSDGTTITPVVSNNTLYFASTNKAFGTGTTSRDIILTYVFTDKNASTTWNRTENVRYADLSEYDYENFKNGTLKEASSSPCVTPETLITLANGTQKEVQYLNAGEELLVWNLETGSYDTAPIVFVDSEQEAEYEVINLNFSDGSEVEVIYEHGFFDLDLGEYVYITADNYSDYIGHKFVVEGDVDQNTWDVATLDSAAVEIKTTTAWSPVTFKHLCYYTDGVLSMPGGISGLFNIFDVDTDIMMYDQEKKAKDLEEYGLLSFEAFEGKIPQIAYEAFNGNYLGVAMGKGLLTWDTINEYVEKYIPLVPSIVAEELLEEVENSSKEPEASSEEPEAPSEEPEAPSEEPEAPSEEPEAPSEEEPEA